VSPVPASRPVHARAAVGVLALAIGMGCAREPAVDRLEIALPAGPFTIAPGAAGEEFSISILSNVYESIVDLGPDLVLRPGLAESWQTPDDSTWVFALRPGARWHDGEPVRASQVIESLERTRHSAGSRRRIELAAVERMEAPDDHTMVVHTSEPHGHLANRLANVSIWRPGARPEDPALGTGPYRVRAWTPGGDTTLQAFDGFEGGHPTLREVLFRAVPEAAQRMRLLRAGDVQLVVDAPPDEMGALAEDRRLMAVSRKGARVVFLAVDCARAQTPYVDAPRNPFADLRVRTALALALDRDALVRGPLRRLASTVDQLVGPEVFGYHDGLPAVRHEPERARALLAEAGWPDGFAVDLDFPTGKYRGAELVTAEMARQLLPVGIRLRPRAQEPEVFFARLERRDTSLYLLGWIGTSGDAGPTYEYLLHTATAGFGRENAGGYSNPELDRLVEQARHLGPVDRLPLLRRVAEIVHRDQPVVPLYRAADVYALDRRLEFAPRLDRRIRAAEIRWRIGS
jgi:peptide/nickel transport system substrate-binding protein